MKNKNFQNCIPLELLKKFDNGLPEVWAEVEKLRNYNKLKDYSIWPNYCYIPVNECLGIMAEGDNEVYNKPEGLLIARVVQPLAALAPWRISKEIYVMNPDVEEILSEQDDVKVNKDILLSLPYYSFYIKTNYLKSYDREIDGFFVCLDYDSVDKVPELRFTYLFSDLEWLEFPLILRFKTIQESLDYIYNSNNTPELKDKDANNELKQLMTKSLQMVLYILSINTDVEEDREQKKIYRPVKDIKAVKNRYSEVRKWDVGFRIGQAIRANKERIAQEHSQTHVGSHSSKRPHMRRGHWHSFWTGPKTGERSIVVKWIPPIFIGAKGEMPVVFHDVK